MTGKAPPTGPRVTLPTGPRALRESSGSGSGNGLSSTGQKAPPSAPRSMAQSAPSMVPTEPSGNKSNKLAATMLSSTTRQPVCIDMVPASVRKKATTKLSAFTPTGPRVAPLKPPQPPPPPGPAPAETVPPPPPPEQPPEPDFDPPPPPPSPPAPAPSEILGSERPLFRLAAPSLSPKKQAESKVKAPENHLIPTPQPSLTWPPIIDPSAPRSYKVIFDPAVQGHKSTYFNSLLAHIKSHATPAVLKERVKGKPGKETIYRYGGETLIPDVGPSNGFVETLPDPQDPRKQAGFRPRAPHKPARAEFYQLQYEYSEHSVGPPPPISVLVTGLPTLAPGNVIRQYFGAYGARSFDIQVDRANGSALGIARIELDSFDSAKKCVEKEHGKKVQYAAGAVIQVTSQNQAHDQLKVVLDGDGSKLKAVMKVLDDRKRLAKRRDAPGLSHPRSGLTTTPPLPSSQTPRAPSSGSTPTTRVNMAPSKLANGIPSKPSVTAPVTTTELPSKPPGNPRAPTPPTLVKARKEAQAAHAKHAPAPRIAHPSLPSRPEVTRGRPKGLLSMRDHSTDRSSSRSRSRTPSQSHSRSRGRRRDRSPSRSGSRSRSHSPLPRRNAGRREWDRAVRMRSMSRTRRSWSRSRSRSPRQSRMEEKQQRGRVLAILAANGHDYARIEGGAQTRGIIKDADVVKYLEGFQVDKVLRDHLGLYATFKTSDAAKRAKVVLNDSTNTRKLVHYTVSISVHSSPPALERAAASEQVSRDDPEAIVSRAEWLIVRELREILAKDIEERVVAADVRKISRRVTEKGFDDSSMTKQEQKPVAGTTVNLKGLSFKKQRKPKPVAAEEEVEADQTVEEQDNRPKKKRRKEEKLASKKAKRKVVLDEDIESEEDQPIVIPKRPLSPDQERAESEEPPKKKQKHAAATKKPKQLKNVLLVAPPVEFESLDLKVAEVRVSSPKSPTPPPAPPDPIEDEEDRYYAKLLLSGYDANTTQALEAPIDDSPAFKKHVTGSARTEGYYKITHAEKAAYVAQYQARTSDKDVKPLEPEHPTPQQHVTSSRSNRADARRRAQGLDEINALNRAVALSKGETVSAANELMFKFNQLQTRKKHLRFSRSPIHDWGLYAMEKIQRGEMVIEYVGEIIRAQVAEKREKAYERQGIGSSYLFRIDEDLVVDATKKGNLGRLINHSCDPNCTAKIISINSEKKIVIYAKHEIELGDEITYDYHFPFEQDKIICLCGSAKCRGTLN